MSSDLWLGVGGHGFGLVSGVEAEALAGPDAAHPPKPLARRGRVDRLGLERRDARRRVVPMRGGGGGGEDDEARAHS